MELYTDEFFDREREGAWRSARTVVPLVRDLVQPKSVVDVGCGQGTWLAVFREYGVEDAFGVDGEYVRRSKLEIPAELFLPLDLQRPFGLNRRFDLVVSLEVAEHLPMESAEGFVGSLVKLGPVILFSAAIPFQGGTGHLNEQWPDYWAALFRCHRFVPVDCLRKRIWQNDDVQAWYAQNTLLFVDHRHLENQPRLKREHELTVASQLSVVHPKLYLEMIEWALKRDEES
jgi:SAM-dependent methyltransferase